MRAGIESHTIRTKRRWDSPPGSSARERVPRSQGGPGPQALLAAANTCSAERCVTRCCACPPGGRGALTSWSRRGGSFQRPCLGFTIPAANKMALGRRRRAVTGGPRSPEPGHRGARVGCRSLSTTHSPGRSQLILILNYGISLWELWSTLAPTTLRRPAQMALLPEMSVPSAGAGGSMEVCRRKTRIPLPPGSQPGRLCGWGRGGRRRWDGLNWLPCICWHQTCPSTPKRLLARRVPTR